MYCKLQGSSSKKKKIKSCSDVSNVVKSALVFDFASWIQVVTTWTS